MTNQQIFDKVLAHLRKQGTASVDARGFCMYRGNGGRMCAVGCLIPDGAYSPKLENKEVAMLPNEVLSAAGIDPTDDDQIKLCGCLQVAHDRYLADMGLDAWEDEMCEIANEFGLFYTPPKDQDMTNWTEWMTNPIAAAHKVADMHSINRQAVDDVLLRISEWHTITAAEFLDDLLAEIAGNTNIIVQYDIERGLFRAALDED